MKRFLIPVLIFLSFAAVAQPGLTAATSNPIPMDVFYGFTVDTTGLSHGPGGAGVTWVFNPLTVVGMDTTLVDNCTSTPYCDSFAGSNIALTGGGSYEYCFTGTSRWGDLGSYSGDFLRIQGIKDLLFYPVSIDSTHADAYSDTMNYFGPTIYETGWDSFRCDGYGTLTTPAGTYSNVLRIHVVSYVKDSSYISAPEINQWQSENYFWFVAGFHFPLLVLGYDTSGSTTPYMSYAEFYTGTPLPSAVGEIPVTTTGFNAYPNPARDRINFSFRLTAVVDASIEISDISGRVVGSISSDLMKAGRNNISYSLSGLPTGVYTAKLQNSDGTFVKRINVRK